MTLAKQKQTVYVVLREGNREGMVGDSPEMVSKISPPRLIFQRVPGRVECT
jgi:hypothetical protein